MWGFTGQDIHLALPVTSQDLHIPQVRIYISVPFESSFVDDGFRPRRRTDDDDDDDAFGKSSSRAKLIK
eukprot:1015186-Amphidinium_carterae.1